jgi:hypothetical protein
MAALEKYNAQEESRKRATGAMTIGSSVASSLTIKQLDTPSEGMTHDFDWRRAKKEGRGILVGNIKEQVTEYDLKQFFMEASIEVEGVFFPPSLEHQRQMDEKHANYAFVSLVHKDDVAHALSLHRSRTIFGWAVDVGHADIPQHQASGCVGRVGANKSDMTPTTSKKSSIGNDSEQHPKVFKQMDVLGEGALEEREYSKLRMTPRSPSEVAGQASQTFSTNYAPGSLYREDTLLEDRDESSTLGYISKLVRRKQMEDEKLLNQLRSLTEERGDLIQQRDDALTGQAKALLERDNTLQMFAQVLGERDALKEEVLERDETIRLLNLYQEL